MFRAGRVLLFLDIVCCVFAQETCIFGSHTDCLFPCHCGNVSHPVDCNKSTGRCASGNCGKVANRQRSGEVCQYGDLLPGKSAVLRGYNDHNRTVFNGTLTDKCNINYPVLQDTLEWIIDLGEMHRIKAICITQNMLHNRNCITELRVSTEKSENYHTCHLHFSENLENICECDLYGHQLTIVPVTCYTSIETYAGYVPLCALEVLGRPYIPVNCSNCLQSASSPCDNGLWCKQCARGWRPPDCKRTCQAGYFGVNCHQKCIVPDKYSCCTWITCNKVTGEVEDDSVCIEWHSFPQSATTQASFQVSPVYKIVTYILVGIIVILVTACVVFTTFMHKSKKKASSKLQRPRTLTKYDYISVEDMTDLTTKASSTAPKQKAVKQSNEIYTYVETGNTYNTSKNTSQMQGPQSLVQCEYLSSDYLTTTGTETLSAVSAQVKLSNEEYINMERMDTDHSDSKSEKTTERQQYKSKDPSQNVY